jgi:hypothetical protein
MLVRIYPYLRFVRSLTPWQHLRRTVSRLIGLAMMLSVTVSAWAQGCPFCYNAAAATKAGGLRALRNGILILMIPPVLIVGVVCLMAIRSGDRYRTDLVAEPDLDPAAPDDVERDLPEAGGYSESAALLPGLPDAAR